MQAKLAIAAPLFFLSLAALATPASSQTLWRVDPDGGADFTTVQEAVDAAATGDILLLLDGDYSGSPFAGKGNVTIEKGLTLQSEVGVLPNLEWVRLRNLPADEVLTLRGLEVRELDVENCLGKVRLQDITDINLTTIAGDLSRVTDSTDVVFDSCFMQPPVPPFVLQTLWIERSRVQLFDTQIEGISGSDGPPGVPTEGEEALLVVDSDVYLQGCTLIGGSTTCFACNAASAVRVEGTSLLRIHDSDLIPGVDSNGVPDPPLDVQGGDVQMITSTSRKNLDIPSPLREGEMPTLTLNGQPGDLYWIFLAPARPAIYNAAWDGPLLLQPGGTILALGALDGLGQATVQPFVQDLPPGVDARRFTLQALFFEAGRFAMGPVEQVTILDSAF